MTPTLPEAQRRLRVCHETAYDYQAPVEVAHHSAWLRPRDTDWQQVHGWQMQIEPEPECPPQQSRDAFGNWRHGFSHARVHERLSVVSRFEVTLRAQQPSGGIVPSLATTATTANTPITPTIAATIAATAATGAARAAGGERPPPTWEQVALSLHYRSGMQQPDAAAFVLGTHFAPQRPLLADFAQGLFTPGRTLTEAARALMGRVHERMVYRPASTDVATSALDALALGHGVCQDYAHLMIGVLRSLGLAARYVSGYLLTHPPTGQPRLLGADASHAWVAVWCGEQGWLALDPTNNIDAGLDHVTLAWGRDYADVAPLRGIIRGGGTAEPSVAVTVEPVAA